jgi:translation initiation factor 2 subunit 2
METTFDEMLINLYQKLESKKQNIKIVLPEPILDRSGLKTIWRNVKQFLKIFNRHPDHFLHFINYETTYKMNWISESKSDGSIFENKMKKEYVYDLMKRYIKDKIMCKSCQSINTQLIKNKDLRRYDFICNDCKNSYVIN